MPKPTNENLWLPDSQFTQEEVNAIITSAAEVYEALGIVKLPFDEMALDGREMNDLRQFAAQAHPHTAAVMRRFTQNSFDY